MDNRKKTIRTITALIIVGGVVYAFSGALINTLLNQIIDEYHLTGANEGLMTSLLSVGMMLAIVVCPLIQGRIKKLTMIFVSGIIMTVAMAVSGMAGKAVLFGIASVVLGIGWGLFDTYANSSIIDLYPDDNSGPMGLFHGFYGVGSLLMPVIIQALLFVFIWRANYYLVAAIMLIVMVIFYIVKRKIDKNGGLQETEEKKLRFKDLGHYLKEKRNVLMILSGIMLTMAQAGFISWIVRYMTLEHDAQSLGTLCITIYWICITVNRFIMPHIKVEKHILLIVGCILFCAAVLAGNIVHDPIFMCVMTGLAGFASGHCVPVSLIIASEGYHGNTTLTTSVMQFAFGIGRVVAPILVALVKTDVSMTAGMFLPAAAALITTILFMVLKAVKAKG